MSKKLVFLSTLTLLLLSTVFAREYTALGDPVALTMEGEYYMAPQWSPRGDQLAASGPSFSHLYLIDFPTGQTTQLSDAPSAGYGFAWSHDATRIATRIATYENRRRTHTLLSIRVEDGSSEIFWGPQSRMTGKPRWSADDTQLHLTFSDNFENIDQHGVRLNTHRSGTVLVKDGQLVAKAAGRTDERILFEDQDRVTSYAISPNGEHIVYSTSGQNLWLTDISGSSRQSLGKGIEPSWAPDSDWFTYMLTDDDGHSMISADVYIMHRDGSSRIRLTKTSDRLEMRPQWSPDGSWIVYDTDDQGQLFIQQMEVR